MTKTGQGTPRSRWLSTERILPVFVVALLTALYLGLHTARWDFETYYLVARMVRSGDGARLYDLPLQAAYQARYIGPLSKAGTPDLPFFYPAATAALFVPLTWLPVRIAFSIWTLFNLALLVFSVSLLQRQLQVPQGYGPLVAALTFVPVCVCLLSGQFSIVMLFLYTVAFRAAKRGDEFAAGFALGLGTLKFQLVLGFFAILLLRRCWKALAGAAVGVLPVAVGSAAVLGWQGATHYPFTLMHSAHVPVFDRPQRMVTLYGLFTSTLRHYPPTWLLVVASAGVIAAAAFLRADKETRFCAALLASTLVSYHAFFYELSIFLIPAAVVASRIERRESLVWSYAIALVTLWALLLLAPIQAAAWTTFAMIAFGLWHAGSRAPVQLQELQ